MEEERSAGPDAGLGEKRIKTSPCQRLNLNKFMENESIEIFVCEYDDNRQD